jgi:hypothetical protein
MNIEVLPPSPTRRMRERTEPVSFQREPPPLVPRGNSWTRWITAKAKSLILRRPAAEIAAESWPSDRMVREIVLRTASAPAMIGVVGWAAELAHTVVKDALEALGPASAGAQLLKASTVLTFDGNGVISAPGFVASAANAGFVAEGQPIPVRQLADAVVQMTPHKLAAIAVLSEEMILSSNAEQLIGDVLIRSAAAALDVALFGTAAATAAQPAGLRNGIAALTPSPNADFWEAYFEDIANGINACSPVGGNGPFALVANAGRAVQIKLRAMGEEPYEIFGSNAVGNDMLVIAPAAIVCAIAPEPEIEIANAATLHMNDTPLPIVNGGAPAAPQKSMWQTATVALKMRWPVTWALRDSRGVSWVTPAWK